MRPFGGVPPTKRGIKVMTENWNDSSSYEDVISVKRALSMLSILITLVYKRKD